MVNVLIRKFVTIQVNAEQVFKAFNADFDRWFGTATKVTPPFYNLTWNGKHSNVLYLPLGVTVSGSRAFPSSTGITGEENLT